MQKENIVEFYSSSQIVRQLERRRKNFFLVLLKHDNMIEAVLPSDSFSSQFYFKNRYNIYGNVLIQCMLHTYECTYISYTRPSFIVCSLFVFFFVFWDQVVKHFIIQIASARLSQHMPGNFNFQIDLHTH